MKCIKTACALGLVAASGVSAHSLTETETNFLKDLREGRISKDDLEIVLAQHSEDTAWSRDYASVVTTYCKGGLRCAEGAVRLDNVGREGHSFLHHIVKNYDKLAKWTVFSQAGAPSEGYLGHQHGGGHMLTGASFEDYILQPLREKDADSLFMMTSKVHLPTLAHSFRSSFKVAQDQRMPMVDGHLGRCPASKTDSWGPFREVPWLHSFVNEKCGIEAGALQEAMSTFWQDYVQLPRPRADVVHYAQGARFAVARERILQRPKAFYERLLQAVATEEDPCLNYLYEFVWHYIIGKPEGTACEVTEAEFKDMQAAGRKLKSHVGGGVSGASGGSDDGSDGGSDTGNGSPKKPPANTDAAMSHRAVGPVLVAGLALAAAGSLA